MVENGFDVAKSSTTIDCIIKKRLKREAFLNQPITNEYRNYDIEFLRVSDYMLLLFPNIRGITNYIYDFK